MLENFMLMEIPGAFEQGQRPDVLRVGDTQNNGRQRSVPLGVVLTGYRLLTTIMVLSIGIPKAVYSYYGQSLISPSLDWVGGMIFTLLFFWLGVIEATRPEVCRWFFQVDLAPAILRILRCNHTGRPLPVFISHHPTIPLLSITEISPTDSRDPLSPLTQRAVTRGVPIRPNTTSSVPTSHPSVVMQEGPQPLTQNSDWSYDDSEDRQHGSSSIDSIYVGHSPEETGYSSGYMPASGPPSYFNDFDFVPRGPPMIPEITPGHTSQAPPSFPCRLCGRLTPLYLVELLGGFCSERHMRRRL